MEVDFGTLSTCLTLEDLTILFSKLLVPFSLPISNIWEFHLLHIVSNFSHSSRFLVTCHGGFHLHFSNNC